MKYRLGLDVGTASVGLVALELDASNQPVKPIYHSVRIFNEPLLPAKSGGIGEPKKAARRLARQQRKGHQRGSRRLGRIAELGRSMGLDPESIDADSGQHIHELRAQAATSEISLEDLLRVFLKMGKRRGYYGGFKVKKDKEKGQVESGISDLAQAMQESECGTLGQYLWKRIQNGAHLRLKEDGLFADRQMVEDEFNRIWDTQEQYHPLLKKEYNGKKIREHFRRAIIEQRPHKSPAAMVGNCSLEPMLPRAPMAQPAMQAFRIEKQIADLRWGTTRNALSLSIQHKEIIRGELQDRKEVNFNSLYRVLERAGCLAPEGKELNLARGERETLAGDKTAAAMKSMGLLKEWKELAQNHQISVINLLADMGSPEVFDTSNWDENIKGAKGASRKVKPEVRDFINKMLDTKKFGRLSKMGFDVGRSSYSIKALTKITAIMREGQTDEHGAIETVYPDFHKTDQGELSEILPKHDTTGNTVVDVALGQVRREVNAVIKQLGTTPNEIIIELSRDMKTGLKTRGELTKKMRRNEQDRKWAAGEIRKSTGKEATPSQIRRYLLWAEQEQKHCPYCERTINCSDAINGNVTEYEHILPKSLTRIGKKRDFLVLAHKSCNQEKENKTPWQAWGHDAERWSVIERRAKHFENGYKVTINGKDRLIKLKGKARQLLIKDFDSETMDNEVIGEFTDRQFQESAWIAKICGKWLRNICSDVSVSRGLLTAHLRRNWGLDTVIPQVRYEEGMPVFDEDYQANKGESSQKACNVSKVDFDKYRSYWEGHHVDRDNCTHRRLNKRIDHRHHLVDALVISMTTRSLYQRMATHYKQVTDTGDTRLRLYAEPELEDIRSQALELVRNCRPSHRPDRWNAGNMFKQNPSTIREEKGELFYAQRKKLTNLAKDENGKALSTEKVRKKINGILPVSSRTIISKAFEESIAAGADPEQALNSVRHTGWDTLIRKVLIKGDKASDALQVRHGNRNSNLHKYLEPEGYAYLEFKDEEVDSKPRLVRLREGLKPEATVSGITRLYKGDTVRDSRDSNLYIIRHIKAEGPSLKLSPVTESIATVDKVSSPRSKKVTGGQIRKLVLVEDVCSSNSTD